MTRLSIIKNALGEGYEYLRTLEQGIFALIEANGGSIDSIYGELMQGVERNKPITRLDVIKKALNDDSIRTITQGIRALIDNLEIQA